MDFILRDKRDLFMELSALAALMGIRCYQHLSKRKDSKTNVAKKEKRKIAEASKAKNRRKNNCFYGETSYERIFHQDQMMK